MMLLVVLVLGFIAYALGITGLQKNVADRTCLIGAGFGLVAVAISGIGVIAILVRQMGL